MNWDRRQQYHCKDCITVAKIVTDVDVAEYKTVPERKKAVQRQGPTAQRHLREIITISGSVGSVVCLVLVLVPK